MDWSVSSWREMPEQIFANCWRKTGLLDGEPDEEPDNEHVIEEQVMQTVQRMNPRQPLTIDELLNPENENAIHQELGDAALLEGAAAYAEEPEEPEEPPVPRRTISDSVKSIRQLLIFLSDEPHDNAAEILMLRELKARLEKQVVTTQTLMDAYVRPQHVQDVA